MRQPTFWRSLLHACEGVLFTFRTQRNSRIHAAVGMLVVALGAWLNIDSIRWAILAVVIGGVIAGETVNTTVEALVDLISPEWHEQAKIAKDVAAGAVLVLSITAAIVGLIILGPPLAGKIVPTT